MTVTKFTIINAIHKELGLSKTKSTQETETLIETIKSILANGEDVMISGFGKFCIHNKKERRGRNPATGEDMLIEARRVVTFKCSGKLRDKMNNK